jgi:hypothetical protein
MEPQDPAINKLEKQLKKAQLEADQKQRQLFARMMKSMKDPEKESSIAQEKENSHLPAKSHVESLIESILSPGVTKGQVNFLRWLFVPIFLIIFLLGMNLPHDQAIHIWVLGLLALGLFLSFQYVVLGTNIGNKSNNDGKKEQ